MTIQVTLFSNAGYKPLSTLIEVESWEEYQSNKPKYQKNALVKICGRRGMTMYHIRKYGQTEIGARVYDPERIAKEKAERYEQIKKERGWN